MAVYSIQTLLNGQVAVGTPVSVQGWVRTRRDSKAGFSFINLVDGSGFNPIQIVAPSSLPHYQEEILRLTAGCSIKVSGELVKSEGQGQSVELRAQTLEVIGFVENPDTYPISPKHHTLEHLREFPHLRVRTNVIGAATRIRHCVSQAIHRYFHEQGFYWIHTPIITTNDCEGAGELFRVSTLDLANIPKTPQGKIDFGQDFFGRETFLTVSGQLNLEAYCLALSKVYTFGPTFRAENSNTSRHLAEFWMVEPEIAFADLALNADLAQGLLKYVFAAVLNERADDMAFFNERIDKDCIARLEHMIKEPFERMDYKAAIEALIKSGKKFENPVKWGLDLQTEHERYLAEELVGRPVIVMNYPKAIKSFYMRVNEDNETVAAMDVLAPGIGEIIGGAQREDRLDLLDARMDEIGLDKNMYAWYRDLRRYGSVPHAGFGLGLERLICYITGLSNVRDVLAYPRTPKHAEM